MPLPTSSHFQSEPVCTRCTRRLRLNLRLGPSYVAFNSILSPVLSSGFVNTEFVKAVEVSMNFRLYSRLTWRTQTDPLRLDRQPHGERGRRLHCPLRAAHQDCSRAPVLRTGRAMCAHRSPLQSRRRHCCHPRGAKRARPTGQPLRRGRCRPLASTRRLGPRRRPHRRKCWQVGRRRSRRAGKRW